MPPSTIIDSDLDPLDNSVMYVVEAREIWKATSLGGGDAVWASVFTPDAWESGEGATGITFSRIRCAKQDGLVYAIGYAHAEGQSGTNYTAYCFVSSNGGATWNGYPIDTLTIDNEVDYYFNGSTYNQSLSGVASSSAQVLDKYTCRWSGTYDASSSWHIANISFSIGGSWELGWPDDITVEFSGNFAASGAMSTDVRIQRGPTAWSLAPSSLGDDLWFIDQCTVYPTTIQGLAIGAGSVYGAGHGGEAWDITIRITKVEDENVGLGKAPFGFDVAPGNTSWLYVGVGEKIKGSEDGGVTWFDFYTDHGANDICVDPQLAGAIYYWATDGNLNLLVKQTLGAVGVLTSEALMTETPMAVPLRIARDINSGRLLALPNGTVLKMRNLGSDTELKTGLTNARGLHCYLGQKIIFVDSSAIYISDDIQAETPTITDKTGEWGDYASGINSHRMTAA